MKLNPKTCAGLLLAAVVAVGGVTRAQQPSRSLAPTELEAFVAQPGVRTTWSKFVGRIDGRTASAIVTAVASASEIAPARTMRGVRIELRLSELTRPSIMAIRAGR